MFSSVSRRGLLLVAFVICMLETGCNDSAITWSAETGSPNGQWLATARSQQWGGPGTADDATTVFVKRINTQEPAKEVLVFSHQYATMNLKMQWVGPSHLHVAYGPSAKPGDHVKLDFQVVKFGDIEISVENLASSSKTTGTTQ